MNQAIADQIREHIEGLDFVDKIAGLVQTVYMDVNGPDGPVQKAFPIACCVTADDCKAGAYNELMPDSAYKTVIYFEDGGMTFTRYEGRYKFYSSTLRLVCWINVAKILSDTCKTGTTCALSSHLITEIIRALPRFPADYTPFHQMYSEVTDQVVRDNSIFSKYTFDEKHVQYLMYPYDYFALTIKTDFAICLESDVVPAPCDDVIEQMTPVATAATDEDCDSFIAHWEEETEAIGYLIDVATDAAFTTLVVDNVDVGDVLEYEVTGLDTGIVYYYRIRCYDDTDESDSSNTITVTTTACDWFLGSYDEMYELVSYADATGYPLASAKYWTSSEHNATNGVGIFVLTGGTQINELKGSTTQCGVIAIRRFTIGNYNVGDTGPAGGLIFYVSGGYFYECAPEEAVGLAWSNITNVLIGTTSLIVGEGQNNTNEIIAQAGHTTSAAWYCDELEV